MFTALARSALVEATAQLSRALDQLGFLPATADLRREQVKLQVALANALMHVKGFAADETNASLDQARLFIERAKDWENLPKTRWCYSRSSTASGSPNS
ncbi:hypothetical protein [Bradyrhizobium erythrophlei]|uniref:hypothetical protein n=1 Tax=Bradyrhizobium erythrophlei TaxID=1437360 RepID=UPI0009A73115|nr:hypothetical protein [Bradyrhizobium erythrophlei]